jgi:hypothetical protein
VVSADNPSGISCSPWTSNAWHHVVYFLQRVGDNRDTVRYGSVTIDGVTRQWNLDEPSVATSWGANLGIQYQLDIGAQAGALTEYADEVTLTTW